MSEELSQIAITRVGILDLLEKLKNSKSQGPDGIHLRVFRELICIMVDLLTSVYNLSL